MSDAAANGDVVLTDPEVIGATFWDVLQKRIGAAYEGPERLSPSGVADHSPVTLALNAAIVAYLAWRRAREHVSHFRPIRG